MLTAQAMTRSDVRSADALSSLIMNFVLVESGISSVAESPVPVGAYGA
jgi:hypothetical protein